MRFIVHDSNIDISCSHSMYDITVIIIACLLQLISINFKPTQLRHWVCFQLMKWNQLKQQQAKQSKIEHSRNGTETGNSANNSTKPNFAPNRVWFVEVELFIAEFISSFRNIIPVNSAIKQFSKINQTLTAADGFGCMNAAGLINAELIAELLLLACPLN